MTDKERVDCFRTNAAHSKRMKAVSSHDIGTDPTHRFGACRLILAALFVVLLVLEVAPLAAILATDALWFMNVPEEFTASLWAPLKPLLPGSYFYHYFGFAYYTAIRPAHWITQWWLGSPEVTIAYTQIYGTIIKAAFSLATVTVAIWVLATGNLSHRAKLVTLLFMLALLAANPYFYWVYHTRVSNALSIKLLSTIVLILTLLCTERMLAGRLLGAGMTAAVGAVGGILFFEHPLYFPLIVYPIALIAATTPPRQIPVRALFGIAIAVFAALAVLTAFYVGDVESIIAAISSHFVGLAAGNPITQPDHHEQFYKLFLHRRSVYFACHVILVAGTLVALAILLGCVFSVVRHRADRTTGVLGLLLVAHVANVGAYTWPLLKHGTNATVYAAAIETLFFIATVSVASGAFRLLRRAIAGVAVAATAIVLADEILPSQEWPGGSTAIQWRVTAFNDIGAVVREFDGLLNELSDGYAVVNGPAFYPNDHVLYWQFPLSEGFNNTVSGLGGLIDERYNGRLQRERHPRYRYWESRSLVGVADQCYAVSRGLVPGHSGRQWACYGIPFAFGMRYANVYATEPPEPTGEAWIEPLPAYVAAPLLADRLAGLRTVSYQEARGQVRAMLLASYPNFGLQGVPAGVSLAVHWEIMPLRSDDIPRIEPIATKTLMGRMYKPFLASVSGARITHYLLWLPLEILPDVKRAPQTSKD
jgi:hypothetical protein